MSRSSQNETGRPPLFTQERAKRVIEAVRLGLTYQQAAAYAGISYATLNRWRIEGSLEDAPPEFCKFWEALEQANGEAAFRLLDRINIAAKKDWKAASWILERRFPKDWGRNADSLLNPMGAFLDA